MRKTTKMLPLFLTVLLILTACRTMTRPKVEVLNAVSPISTYAYVQTKDIAEFVEAVIPVEEEKVSKEDIELIALVTMAEAEGEPEEGQRLVIDTILNRVDSERFPDTIYDVIYQPNQFSPMWNGRIDRCEVREELCALVRDELESRTNYDVVFFNAHHYSKYGVQLFQVGNHYFSSYD